MRVWRHFRRLVHETTGLIKWQFVLGSGNGVRSQTRFRYPEPQTVLPSRFQQMQHNGGIQPGFLDVVIVPCVLALKGEHVWVMEYDVDYSGCWADFFAPLAETPADVLTSTLVHVSECEDWAHWPTAAFPAWVDVRHVHRAFHPLMRLSSRFARAYTMMMLDPDWGGHSEFTIPTAAAAAGAVLEDLGGEGTFTPPARWRASYENTPSHPDLSPGTFVWRPAREHYFHECPQVFPVLDRLYHPVKPCGGAGPAGGARPFRDAQPPP